MIDRLAYAAGLGKATGAKADAVSQLVKGSLEVAHVMAAQSLQQPNPWAILKSTSTSRPRERFAHTAAR